MVVVVKFHGVVKRTVCYGVFCPAVAMILFAAVKFYRRELAGIEEASRRPTGPLAPGPALREEMVKSSGGN
jgi:hypothetical protein